MSVVIVSGHGNFSLGLLDAFEMVFGADEKIKAVPFLKGEGIPQLQEKFKQQMDLFEGEEILFLVDVFGGTPYNAATQLVYGKEGYNVISGVNLPMLLETATIRDQSLDKLVNIAKMAGDNSIKVFSEEIEVARVKSVEDDEL